jgi:hypothetical protein
MLQFIIDISKCYWGEKLHITYCVYTLLCAGDNPGRQEGAGGEVRGVYDFVYLIFFFLQKSFCKFLKKKESFSYTIVFKNQPFPVIQLRLSYSRIFGHKKKRFFRTAFPPNKPTLNQNNIF